MRCHLDIAHEFSGLKKSTLSYTSLTSKEFVKILAKKIDTLRRRVNDFSKELKILQQDHAQGRSTMVMTRDERELFEIFRDLSHENLRMHIQNAKEEEFCCRCKHVLSLLLKQISKIVYANNFQGHTANVIGDLFKGKELSRDRLEYTQNIYKAYIIVHRALRGLSKQVDEIESEVAAFEFPFHLSMCVSILQRLLSGWIHFIASTANLLKMAMVSAGINIHEDVTCVDAYVVATDWDIAAVIDRVHQLCGMMQNKSLSLSQIRFFIADIERLRRTTPRGTGNRNEKITDMARDYLEVAFATSARARARTKKESTDLAKSKNSLDYFMERDELFPRYQKRRYPTDDRGGDASHKERESITTDRTTTSHACVPSRPSIIAQDICRSHAEMSTASTRSSLHYYTLFHSVIGTKLNKALKTRRKRKQGISLWKRLQMFVKSEMFSSKRARPVNSEAGVLSQSLVFERNRKLSSLNPDEHQDELQKRVSRRVKRLRQSIIDKLTVAFMGYTARGVAVPTPSIETCLQEVRHFPATKDEHLRKEFAGVARGVLASMNEFKARVRKKNIEEMITTFGFGELSQESSGLE
eukprot:g2165.t1